MNLQSLVLSLLILSFSSQYAYGQIQENELNITASSTLSPSKTSNFSPDNLMDGTSASWSEGVKGNGVGEKFFLDFKYPDQLKYISVKNGYGVKKYFNSNARIKQMRISDASGLSRTIVLKDSPEFQNLGLTPILQDEYGMSYPDLPLSGKNFTFEILSVYEGERWADACITEIMVNQWYTENFELSFDYISMNLYREFFNGIVDSAGKLFIESDWDGYIEANFENGFYFSEITSGDGTEGYDEYQVFINGLTNDYYLFHSSLVSSISQAGMEGAKDSLGRPERVQTNSWEFYIYNKESSLIVELDESDLEDLFIVVPSKEAWLSIVSPALLKENFNPETDEGVYYEWDGNWFRPN